MEKLIEFLRELDQLAQQYGVENIFQPGIAREIVIAHALGHELNPAKHGRDASLDGRPCEYLTANVGRQIQIDRVFKEPLEKRERSLNRIRKYDHIFAVYFISPLSIHSAYELDKEAMLWEAERQLNLTSNSIAHLCFGYKFVQENGRQVSEIYNFL